VLWKSKWREEPRNSNKCVGAEPNIFHGHDYSILLSSRNRLNMCLTLSSVHLILEEFSIPPRFNVLLNGPECCTDCFLENEEGKFGT